MTRATVESIVADRDALRCLRALAKLVEAGERLPFERRPRVRGMLGALAALQWAVESAGIWKFLAEEEGSAFHECVGWCRDLGARRAVAYLDAVAALYPRGRVPRDAARRYALVERIERKSVRTGEPNALRVLDKKHRGATDDMARKVRAWAKSHVAEIEAVVPSAPQRERRGVSALAPSMAPRLTGAELKAKNRAALREELARADAPYADGPVDPRVVRFYDALRDLTKTQWVTIAVRVFAKPVRYERAYERISEAVLDAIRGDLMSREEWKRRSVPAFAVRDAADSIFAELPEVVRHAGKPLRLRYLAERAANKVCSVLLVRDEIAEQETAVKAAQVLLEPFDGIVRVL